MYKEVEKAKNIFMKHLSLQKKVDPDVKLS
jgi:hypothetical protein